MQWSSKHVFERDDSHAISCAISRQEKGGFHKCIAWFLTYSSTGRADTWFPSLPRKECTGVRYVITKFSRMDGLPNFLTHGAPLARFARQSSAITISSQLYLFWLFLFDLVQSTHVKREMDHLKRDMNLLPVLFKWNTPETFLKLFKTLSTSFKHNLRSLKTTAEQIESSLNNLLLRLWYEIRRSL